MPYISTEEVKKIRESLKKELPEFKLSVCRENGHALCVHLMAGPVKFPQSYDQVNHFHYRNHYEGDALKVLDRVMGTIDALHPRKIEHEDSDYGSIPNYYLHLQVGKWNKPYIKTTCDICGLKLSANEECRHIKFKGAI